MSVIETKDGVDVVDCILINKNGKRLSSFPLTDQSWVNLEGGCCIECIKKEDGTVFEPAAGSDKFCRGDIDKCYHSSGQCPNNRISDAVPAFELNDKSAPYFLLSQVEGHCDTFRTTVPPGWLG